MEYSSPQPRPTRVRAWEGEVLRTRPPDDRTKSVQRCQWQVFAAVESDIITVYATHTSLFHEKIKLRVNKPSIADRIKSISPVINAKCTQRGCKCVRKNVHAGRTMYEVLT